MMVANKRNVLYGTTPIGMNSAGNKGEEGAKTPIPHSPLFHGWGTTDSSSTLELHGSKKLANAHPTPSPSTPSLPTPLVIHLRQSNKQSSPSSTINGKFGCKLGWPASCNTSYNSPSFNVKNGKEKYERGVLFVPEPAEGGLHGWVTTHVYLAGLSAQESRGEGV